MSPIIQLRVLIFLSLLCLYVTSASAKQYQVELVLFSQYSPQALIKETLNNDAPRTRQPNQIIELNSTSNIIKPLSSNSFALSGIDNRLRRSDYYRPMGHIAWLQSTAAGNSFIHFYGGNGYDTQGNIVTSNPNMSATNRQVIWQFNGYIQIQFHRYSDITLDMDFAEPTKTLRRLYPQINFGRGPITYFHVKQTRRLRSNELNYIDYPVYGILLKIIPTNLK